MAFERGSFGQQNRALFYGVDRIVYVEGGREVNGRVESFDAAFWRVVFKIIRPDLKLHFVPRGSKAILVEIAMDAINDSTKNVIVAMDRDYEGFFGKIVHHSSVVYTFGYSYENDIYCINALIKAFYALCPLSQDDPGAEEDAIDLIASFSRDVWWAHLADICGIQVGQQVIDRGKVSRYLIKQPYGSRPKVDKNALFEDVIRANRARTRAKICGAGLRSAMIPLFAVGHLYAAFCFRGCL